MRHLTTYKVLMCLLSAIVFFAHPPVPMAAASSNAVITPANASRLREIGTLGRGWVRELAWSPDGKLLAVASSTGIWLHNVDRFNEEPRHLPMTYLRLIQEMVFSPDSNRLVVVEEKTTTIWDLVVSKKLAMVPSIAIFGTGDRNPVRFANERTLVIRREKGTVQIINLDTKQRLYQFAERLDYGTPLFSPDARKVIFCHYGAENICDLWDMAANQKLVTLHDYEEPTWSPDSSTVADKPVNGNTVKVWHIAQKKQLVIQSGRVYQIIWSPHSELIAASNQDLGTRVWNVKSGQVVANTRTQMYGDFAFTADGTGIVGQSYSSDDNNYGYNVAYWSFRESSDVHLIRYPPSDYIPFYIAVSPNKRYIAASGMSDIVGIWDISTKKALAELHYHGLPESLAFSPDSKLLAVGSGSPVSANQGSWDNTVWLWNVVNQTASRAFTDHKERVLGLDFTADGKYLVSSGMYFDGARIWSLEDIGGPLNILAFDGFIYGVMFSPDERRVALVVDAGPDDFPIVWRSTWANKQPSGSKRLPTGLSSRYMTFSNNNRLLAVGNTLYDTVAEKHVLHLDTYAPFVAFSPDDLLLATGRSDWGGVDLWNVRTGTRRFTWYVHQEGTYYGKSVRVAFSPDGKLLAAGGAGNLLIFDVNTGRELITLHSPGEAEILSMAFSPDGRLLAVGSWEGTVRLWGIKS